MDKYLIFDSVVLEAVTKPSSLSKIDIAMLDKTTKKAYEIYNGKEIQEIRNGVRNLPKVYQEHPEKVDAYCKALLKKVKILEDELGILEVELKHRGNSTSYRRNQQLQSIMQWIGTSLIMIVGSLLRLEPQYVSSSVSGMGTYAALKDTEANTIDMQAYNEYAKLRNDDPLKLVQLCLADLTIIRRYLNEVLISK